MRECGGCQGQGRHRRWCPEVVGSVAAYYGRMSVEADNLGDQIGPNDMGCSNMCWQVAARLRLRADQIAEAYMAQNGTHH